MANVKQYTEGNTLDTNQPTGELVYVGDNSGGKLRVYVEPNKFVDVGTPPETDSTFAYAFSATNNVGQPVTIAIPHTLGRIPKFVTMRGKAYDGGNQYHACSNSYGTVENWDAGTDSGDNQFENSYVSYFGNFTPAVYSETTRSLTTKATRILPLIGGVARKFEASGSIDFVDVRITEMTDTNVYIQIDKQQQIGTLTGYFQMELR